LIYFTFLWHANYGDFPQPVQLLQVPQLIRQVEVVHRPERAQDQPVDYVSLEQRHFLYPLNCIQDDHVPLVHEGEVFIRVDENKRDALNVTLQFSCKLNCPPVARDIRVAENIDLHLIPFYSGLLRS